jgi:phage replication O-like protein O
MAAFYTVALMGECLQLNDGYARIVHGIFLALAQYKMSNNCTRVLMVIFRMTYGYQRKEAQISLDKFEERTGMHKPHISRAIKSLTYHNIITQSGNYDPPMYSFQKYYTKWKPWEGDRNLGSALPNRVITVTQSGNASFKDKYKNKRDILSILPKVDDQEKPEIAADSSHSETGFQKTLPFSPQNSHLPPQNTPEKPPEAPPKDDTNDKNGKPIPYKRIIDYLNGKVGKHFKVTTPVTRTNIKARFNQGFTFEDFVTVIDRKYEDWKDDEYYSRFLRPETLFGNKFDGYLNEAPRQNKKACSWSGWRERVANVNCKEGSKSGQG